ncbi:hypothetical protein HMN09_00348500 [Mycena chlorophos]|uniref:Uncharacterized protein n=1 Tax=Mycena chlorophos TaxID=658473 RepID=A0A8H6WKT0_MYCCL|nr:hypothetical protein HMN09_00348500 [Mycena chlorophos]
MLQLCPHLSYHVRSLTLPHILSNDVYALLTQIAWPRLHTLSLYPAFDHSPTRDNINTLISKASQLRKLSLSFQSALDCDTLYPLLHVSPSSLEVLTLQVSIKARSSGSCSPKLALPPKDPSTYPRIRELIVDNSWNVLEMLVDARCPVDLTHMHTLQYCDFASEAAGIGRPLEKMFHVAEPALRELHLNISDPWMADIDPSSLSRLAHLHVQYSSGILTLLSKWPAQSNLSSILFHTVASKIALTAEELQEAAAAATPLFVFSRTLEDVVLRPGRFPQLTTVTISLNAWSSEEDAQEIRRQIQALFPRLHGKQMLAVHF